MEYREPYAREFILRTLSIIEQYETHVPSGPEKYEQTLLLNCLLGLLVLPSETQLKTIDAGECAISAGRRRSTAAGPGRRWPR